MPPNTTIGHAPREGIRPICKLSFFVAALVLGGSMALSDISPRTPNALGKGVLKEAAQPDLIIEPRCAGTNGLPKTGHCDPWNGGNQKVYFYVTIDGAGAAGASHAFVSFGGNLSALVAVPALAPDQSTLRNATIPYAAWGPGGQIHGLVDLLIAADHNDEMAEGNVTNTYGEGDCIGPAG